jgi:hypothetical protein
MITKVRAQLIQGCTECQDLIQVFFVIVVNLSVAWPAIVLAATPFFVISACLTKWLPQRFLSFSTNTAFTTLWWIKWESWELNTHYLANYWGLPTPPSLGETWSWVGKGVWNKIWWGDQLLGAWSCLGLEGAAPQSPVMRDSMRDYWFTPESCVKILLRI